MQYMLEKLILICINDSFLNFVILHLSENAELLINYAVVFLTHGSNSYHHFLSISGY